MKILKVNIEMRIYGNEQIKSKKKNNDIFMFHQLISCFGFYYLNH